MLLMVENLSISKIKDYDKNRQSFYLSKIFASLKLLGCN